MIATEEQISTLVREFYDSARADDRLGKIFNDAVLDWDHHLATISDFWSNALLGTRRYTGHPFPVHMKLPIEPDHFDRWLALFKVAADSTLPPDAAAEAKGKASQMIEGFRIGLYPFVGADGKPSRVPLKS